MVLYSGKINYFEGKKNAKDDYKQSISDKLYH